MSARLSVGVVGLVLVLLAGLAVAAPASPTPSPSTSTATASTATPTPFVTPVGCGFFAYTPTPGTAPPPNPTAPGGPAVPTDLRVELVSDPELATGFAVHLAWQDNADNETCFGVAERVQGELIGVVGLSAGLDGTTTGPMTLKDVPDETGQHCYQVYYGNAVGLSHSNEVCVNVEVLPVWATATPTPTLPTGSPTPLSGPLFPWSAACQGEGPVGAPGAPSPPTNLRAEPVQDSTVLEGFVVRLEWYDNADNEACSVVERKIGEGEWALQGGSGPSDPWNTGSVFVNDVPEQLGMHCYRIFYANDAGRSDYSNEACVDVKIVPKILAPTPPPVRCYLEDLPRSELGPAAPTNLTALLVADPTVPGGLRVDLTWQDNAADEQCHAVERLEHDGAWHSLGRGVGEDPTTAIDAQPWLGPGCYRVSVANDLGWSDYSNEACATGPAVTVTPTPITTPTPSTPVTPRALPILGASPSGGSAGLAWWTLAAAGAVLLGVAVLGTAWVARRRL